MERNSCTDLCLHPFVTLVAVEGLFERLPVRAAAVDHRPSASVLGIRQELTELVLPFVDVTVSVVDMDAGQPVLSVPSHTRLEDRLRTLFPAAIGLKLREFFASSGAGVNLRCFLSPAEELISSKAHQYVYWDGRARKMDAVRDFVNRTYRAGLQYRLHKMRPREFLRQGKMLDEVLLKEKSGYPAFVLLFQRDPFSSAAAAVSTEYVADVASSCIYAFRGLPLDSNVGCSEGPLFLPALSSTVPYC